MEVQSLSSSGLFDRRVQVAVEDEFAAFDDDRFSLPRSRPIQARCGSTPKSTSCPVCESCLQQVLRPARCRVATHRGDGRPIVEPKRTSGLVEQRERGARRGASMCMREKGLVTRALAKYTQTTTNSTDVVRIFAGFFSRGAVRLRVGPAAKNSWGIRSLMSSRRRRNRACSQ